jgi:hypothetical protein
MHEVSAELPRLLSAYPVVPGTLWDTLRSRVELEPFNAVATGIFVLAILHTFAASRFTALAHQVQHAHDADRAGDGLPPAPSLRAEALHFLGEIEVVFGLWALAVAAAMLAFAGWPATQHYLNDTVNYTEPMFVVVIMALASARPVVVFAEAAISRLARLAGGTPLAWWATILIVGPLLGSLVTEPAAMTICALVLARQFFDLNPSARLKYATLGLLFVNVSIGGTLTQFAAPPVLMVARAWEWDLPFMAATFGWKAALAIVLSTAAYALLFRAELTDLAGHPAVPDREVPDDEAAIDAPLPAPAWVTAVHLSFMAWTVLNAHYPVLFVGGFLFFLGFSKATAVYQSRLELRTPLLVGFFLGGLVIHGGVQGWWIAPVLASLDATPLFLGAGALTAFNDNALITYLATLVPALSEELKIAVVEGAVVGGGMTVIANAPNPAGQALLSRFFGGAVSPLGLASWAAVPTVIAALVFRVL